jgi:DNA (cytosine-5)-methyltransferase 1
VIENVPGAPLGISIMLCGTMFNLKTPCGAELRRHRYFELSHSLLTPRCSHGGRVIGVYGGHLRDRCRTITVTGSTPQQNVVRNRVRQTFSVESARIAMGIDWMPMSSLSQAIPPAYTEWIGKQLIKALK